mmetsp:Transcript_158076/g.507107  ORF Transcript_158076/g.507107 Transcript_158076/m.507107 type:complete len:287 (-) Transcript_158076:1884-2744(-)
MRRQVRDPFRGRLLKLVGHGEVRQLVGRQRLPTRRLPRGRLRAWRHGATAAAGGRGRRQASACAEPEDIVVLRLEHHLFAGDQLSFARDSTLINEDLHSSSLLWDEVAITVRRVPLRDDTRQHHPCRKFRAGLLFLRRSSEAQSRANSTGDPRSVVLPPVLVPRDHHLDSRLRHQLHAVREDFAVDEDVGPVVDGHESIARLLQPAPNSTLQLDAQGALDGSLGLPESGAPKFLEPGIVRRQLRLVVVGLLLHVRHTSLDHPLGGLGNLGRKMSHIPQGRFRYGAM